MISVRALCLAALTTLVAACGNIATVKSFSTPYQEPSAGPRARIRVVSDSMVRAVPNSACVDWRLEGAGVMVVTRNGFANLNGRKLGMPKSPAQELAAGSAGFVISELYVPAGKPLVMDYLSVGNAGGQCNVRQSFVPTAGVDYEAVFFEEKAACKVRVKSIDGPLLSAVELAPAALCRISDNL